VQGEPAVATLLLRSYSEERIEGKIGIKKKLAAWTAPQHRKKHKTKKVFCSEMTEGLGGEKRFSTFVNGPGEERVERQGNGLVYKEGVG